MAGHPGVTVGAVWLLLDSSAIGGIESHVATLAVALRDRGHAASIVLYAPHQDNPWLDQLRAAGLDRMVLDGTPLALFRALQRERPAVLHTHGYKAGIVGRFAARLAGVPVISTFHAGERAPFPVSLYQRVDEWTSALGGRIAVSQQIADALPFGARVIGNFVPPGPERADTDGHTIAFVGRLSHEKGPDLFCEIARRADPALRFEVYGDGPMRAALEGEYGERVRFHGVRAGMRDVWLTIDVLLMPSRAEGLPMAALEAMAAGVPVLASAVGGLPSLVRPGETGWLFEPGDEQGALASLGRWRALTDPERRDIGERCREDVARRYGPDMALTKIMNVYRATADGAFRLPQSAAART